MIPITPNSVAIQIGSFPVYWYGIAYAVGLAVTYVVMAREARRRGYNVEILANGMIIVAVAALIGGRAYHVIDQWQLYRDDLLKIVLPPYSGLGVYGGLATGVLAAVLYARWLRVPFWPWADVVAPGLFAMQMVGRWGNFFNQELYGPPTSLPWGIQIDCAHRLVDYPCELYPLESTGFHPLFLYESLSGLLGMLVLLWAARRFSGRLRHGDLLLIFFIWYPIVRFLLETLRTENWKLGGIPTAQLVSVVFVAVSAAVLVYRHRPGHGTDAPMPAAGLAPAVATASGGSAAAGAPSDEDPWADDPDWDAADGDDSDEDDGAEAAAAAEAGLAARAAAGGAAGLRAPAGASGAAATLASTRDDRELDAGGDRA